MIEDNVSDGLLRLRHNNRMNSLFSLLEVAAPRGLIMNSIRLITQSAIDLDKRGIIIPDEGVFQEDDVSYLPEEDTLYDMDNT